MSDKIELLPCPFCGGIDIGHSYIETYSCDSSYRVFGCISCGARFEEGDAQNWNRRAALAQQPAPAAPVVREPVAFVSQETFSSDGTSDILTRNLPIGTALYAVPPAAEQAPRELFTCIGKGGRYELLGHSSGAGGCRREGRVIYRCLDTGQLYHRTDDDFAAQMAPLNEEGKA